MNEQSVVESPNHYKILPDIEAFQIIEVLVKGCDGVVAYHYGSTLKYVLRCMKKNGLEDLKKARKHLDWLIENMEKDQ